MPDIKQYEPLWGSWYVDSLIGEGSFGKVYKVRREEFGNTYYSAVKMVTIPQNDADLRQIKSEGYNDASARSYFQAFVSDIIQEINLMSAFRGNSNVVSFEDHKVIEQPDSIGWDILIRMELLTSLTEQANNHPLTTEDVIKLGIHICKALELCALKNTIHRDIKPDNIFLSEYGDYKLGDFGIARQIERTMSGLSKKGTYTYMAPEVFRGEEYGASVDIYSLGIVMYRFLNQNRTPFLPDFPAMSTPKDRDEALQRRMKGEAIPPIKGVDPALGAIVLRACAFDRKARFANATEMREALEKLMNGQAVSYAPVQTVKTAVTGEDTDATVRFFENAAEHENTGDKTHLVGRGAADTPNGAYNNERTSGTEGVFATTTNPARTEGVFDEQTNAEEAEYSSVYVPVTRLKNVQYYILFAVLVALLDQLFKHWVSTISIRIISGGGIVILPRVIHLTYLENTGAAFSILSNMRWILVMVSLVSIALLIVILFSSNRGFLSNISLSAVIGGTVGNLIDRIFTGKIIDMFELDFIHFAVFNIADIFIIIGGIIFCLSFITRAFDYIKLWFRI